MQEGMLVKMNMTRISEPRILIQESVRVRLLRGAMNRTGKGAGPETGSGPDRVLPWQLEFRVNLGTRNLRAMGAV